MLNGNARRHNNFRCRIAQQMAADDTVAVIQHQFAQSIAQLVLGNKTTGIRHRQLLYVITGTECFQFLFGLSHPGNFRIGIDHTRYAVVVHRILHSQNVINRHLTLTNCRMRQHGTACYVATGINTRMGGLHVLIHFHTVTQQFDIQLIQPCLAEVCLAPYAYQNFPGLYQRSLAVFFNGHPFMGHSRHFRAQIEVDATLQILRTQHASGLLVHCP